MGLAGATHGGVATRADRAPPQDPAPRDRTGGDAVHARGRHGRGGITPARALVPGGCPHTPPCRRLSPRVAPAPRHDEARGRAWDPRAACGVTARSRRRATTAATRRPRSPPARPLDPTRVPVAGREPRDEPPAAPVGPSPPGERRAHRPDRSHVRCERSVAPRGPARADAAAPGPEPCAPRAGPGDARPQRSVTPHGSRPFPGRRARPLERRAPGAARRRPRAPLTRRAAHRRPRRSTPARRSAAPWACAAAARQARVACAQAFQVTCRARRPGRATPRAPPRGRPGSGVPPAPVGSHRAGALASSRTPRPARRDPPRGGLVATTARAAPRLTPHQRCAGDTGQGPAARGVRGRHAPHGRASSRARPPPARLMALVRVRPVWVGGDAAVDDRRRHARHAPAATCPDHPGQRRHQPTARWGWPSVVGMHWRCQAGPWLMGRTRTAAHPHGLRLRGQPSRPCEDIRYSSTPPGRCGMSARNRERMEAAL